MHHTRDIDEIGAALVDLVGFFNSPKRDDALLSEASVKLDRALFQLLVWLNLRGRLSVAGLAAQAGRDHSTVSRQLAKLQTLGLVARSDDGSDGRVHTATLTPAGEDIVRAIKRARRRLLSKALSHWTTADRAALAQLSRRFADDLTALAAATGR